MRMYQGIDKSVGTPQQVRSALHKIDQYLRDQSRDASRNQSTGSTGQLSDEPYLVASLSGNLTSERLLTFAAPLVRVDGGAGGNFSVSLNFSNGTYGIGANGNGALDMWYKDTSAAFEVRQIFTSSSALTADRTLTIDVANGSRTLKMTGNPTLDDWFDQSVKTTASPTFVGLSTTGDTVIGNAAGDSLRINAGGGASAPATNAIGVVVDYYGTSATRVLTTPDRWTTVTSSDGNNYRIPLYAA